MVALKIPPVFFWAFGWPTFWGSSSSNIAKKSLSSPAQLLFITPPHIRFTPPLLLVSSLAHPGSLWTNLAYVLYNSNEEALNLIYCMYVYVHIHRNEDISPFIYLIYFINLIFLICFAYSDFIVLTFVSESFCFEVLKPRSIVRTCSNF